MTVYLALSGQDFPHVVHSSTDSEEQLVKEINEMYGDSCLKNDNVEFTSIEV